MMLFHKVYPNPDTDQWVIMIHGVGGSSTIFFKQIREYQKHFNLLLVDLRGHGKSQPADERAAALGSGKYSFEQIAWDVLEVMDHLQIAKAHFIGISLGTIVVRTIGELSPERITSMVLGGAVTRLNFRSKFLMWSADRIKKMVPFIWLYSFYAFILMPRSRNRESRTLFIREARRLARKEIMRWFSLTAEVNPLLRYFAETEIPVPTLYIMGDEDYMFLPQTKRLVERHRHSLLRVLDACGHVVNVEKPDLFNEISIRFLKNPQQALQFS